jgi:glycosyltransferase involved in cell wall biosynthesis
MTDSVAVSLIIPAYNEEACIEGTVREAHSVLKGHGKVFELIVINDGSTDKTPEILDTLSKEMSELRVLDLRPQSGQSAGFGAGFTAARGDVIVLMDADGQNDPADIPELVKRLDDCDICCGWRKDRQDKWSRSFGSKLANAIRGGLLKDGIIDTGCSLKAFKAKFVRDLPMDLKGMHRFLPALAQMRGAKVAQVPVNHRERQGGESKYTNFGRLMVTVSDLFAVRWMQKRHKNFEVKERG